MDQAVDILCNRSNLNSPYQRKIVSDIFESLKNESPGMQPAPDKVIHLAKAHFSSLKSRIEEALKSLPFTTRIASSLSKDHVIWAVRNDVSASRLGRFSFLYYGVSENDPDKIVASVNSSGDSINAAMAELQSILDSISSVSEHQIHSHHIKSFLADIGPRRMICNRTYKDLLNDFLCPSIHSVSIRAQALLEAHKDYVKVSSALDENGLARYAECFPLARNIDRSILFFAGPTNAGKTFASLYHLTQYESGTYLAPLRLLALENYERMNDAGFPCSFITGEEQVIVPEATYSSRTIETCCLDKQIDLAIIDEVQLLAGRDERAWAWSQALIGVPAKTVITCGSSDAIPVVARIARHLGEKFEVQEFKRFCPLEVDTRPASLDHPEKGDIYIAFSRKAVLRLRAYFLSKGIPVACVYGSLSPAVRRSEARRFRSGEAHVMVASDAIAYGLNLPARRIIFTSTRKYDGVSRRQLNTQEILQISGRAGRYGFHEQGICTALSPFDLDVVRKAFIESPAEHPPIIPVQPSIHHITALSNTFGDTRLHVLLAHFENFYREDHQSLSLKPQIPSDTLQLAYLVDQSGLSAESLEDGWVWACAPVDVRNQAVFSWYHHALLQFCQGNPVNPPSINQNYKSHPTSPKELEKLENMSKQITLYDYFSHKYPGVFPDVHKSHQVKDVINSAIEKALCQELLLWRCKGCGNVLPMNHHYDYCDRCYNCSQGYYDE